VRHRTAENRLTDPSLVTDAEVAWYLDEAIFLVSEDEAGVQGFACANHQTGRSKGWRQTGVDMRGQAVFRL
jgi:hypothetical protein